MLPTKTRHEIFVFRLFLLTYYLTVKLRTKLLKEAAKTPNNGFSLHWQTEARVMVAILYTDRGRVAESKRKGLPFRDFIL